MVRALLAPWRLCFSLQARRLMLRCLPPVDGEVLVTSAPTGGVPFALCSFVWVFAEPVEGIVFVTLAPGRRSLGPQILRRRRRGGAATAAGRAASAATASCRRSRQAGTAPAGVPDREREAGLFVSGRSREPLRRRNLCSSSISRRIGAAMIRKLKSGQFRLYSRKRNPKTGKRRNLGTFASRAAAEKHERAVQYFKRGG